MIVQSKMNSGSFIRQNDSRHYSSAVRFLNRLPQECWIRIEDVPEKFRFEVIDMIDGMYRPEIATAFNEDFTKFILTQRRIMLDTVKLNASTIDIANISGYKRCSRCKEVKKTSEFNKNASHSDGYSYLCKECLNS